MSVSSDHWSPKFPLTNGCDMDRFNKDLSRFNKDLSSPSSTKKRVQARVTRLHGEIERLEAIATGLREQKQSTEQELVKSQKQLIEKDEKMDYYEATISARDREIEQLKQSLTLSNRRQAELEVELDFHDLKFSLHEENRKALDMKSLNKAIGVSPLPSLLQEEQKGNFPAQGMNVNELELQLLKMEKLYTNSNVEKQQRIFDLQEECAAVRSKADTLERTIAEYKTPQKSGAETGHASNSLDDERTLPLYFYRNRMEILEVEKSSTIRKIAALQWQLSSLRRAKNKELQEIERQNTALELENISLKGKIGILETELGQSSDVVDVEGRSKQYAEMSNQINAFVAKILRLEERLRKKERIIFQLRGKSVDRRLFSQSAISPVQQKLVESSFDSQIEGKSIFESSHAPSVDKPIQGTMKVVERNESFASTEVDSSLSGSEGEHEGNTGSDPVVMPNDVEIGKVPSEFLTAQSSKPRREQTTGRCLVLSTQTLSLEKTIVLAEQASENEIIHVVSADSTSHSSETGSRKLASKVKCSTMTEGPEITMIQSETKSDRQTDLEPCTKRSESNPFSEVKDEENECGCLFWSPLPRALGWTQRREIQWQV